MDKKCTTCNEIKSTEHFHKNTRGKDGKSYKCSKCTAIYHKMRQDKDPLYRVNINMKHRYGITQKEYAIMLHSQNNKCLICGEKSTDGRRLSVDHCHKTSKVRGLLCNLCNSGIGKFKDNPDILIKAAEYLNTSNLLQSQTFAD